MNKKDKARFWSKVDQGDLDDCWMWRGTTQRQGYGRFWMQGKNLTAHRVALSLSLDAPLSGLALHTCDTPGCVNPYHLYEGTHQDNMDDKHRRNRARYCRPTRLARQKLTHQQVRDIRSSTKSCRAAAQAHNISPEQVRRIRNGERWSHLP